MYDNYRKTTARKEPSSPPRRNVDIQHVPAPITSEEPMTLQDKLTAECKRKLYDLDLKKRSPKKPERTYDQLLKSSPNQKQEE
jgi:hypothetical protein